MSPIPGLASILPPGMTGDMSPTDGYALDLGDKPPPLPRRPSHTAASAATLDATTNSLPRAMERSSTSNLRKGFGSGSDTHASTIRAVTPEPAERMPWDRLGVPPSDHTAPPLQQMGRSASSSSPQSAPRAIPLGSGTSLPTAATAHDSSSRRQGMIFNDAFATSFESDSSSPPPPRQPNLYRPRTHTVDGALRQHLVPTYEQRNRVESFSSTGSASMLDDLRSAPHQPSLESLGYPSVVPARPLEVSSSTAAPVRDKKLTRRLVKRVTSQPTSPLISAPPSVDSLPLPIPTDDANKVLLLMKTLCGRMRGHVRYQSEIDGPWQSGIGYIDEEKGALMFDPGDQGASQTTLFPDLRGCRVFPVDVPSYNFQALELSSAQIGLEIRLAPLVSDEYDLWLAALICWQQLRNGAVKGLGSRFAGPTSRAEPSVRRRQSSNGLRHATIIKVGKLMLWDKGSASTPRAIVKRPSTRDLQSAKPSWKKVSCLLQANGDFKLMTENDDTVLSIIDLSQLARCSIQRLDKSVLDEEFCIAILPIYSPSSTQLSIFRPIFIAFDSRVLLEVWFVLLRAFAVPDIYGVDRTTGELIFDLGELEAGHAAEVFRLEKMLSVKVTEAKVKGRNLDNPPQDQRQGRVEVDPFIGNYLAEVILDGEVRARTLTKTNTKNPFWREDYNFTELPSTNPYLSVLLKRVDGNPDSLGHQLQASLGLPKSGDLVEITCGTVDIPLHNFEPGKDHEQWLQIYDDRQQPIGSMFVKIAHEELVVLLAKDYQGLSDQLHQFGSNLTMQIVSALPGSSRKLAEIFLNIFQVSGAAMEWLMNLVEDEIDGAGAKPALKDLRFNRRLRSNESTESVSDREQVVRDTAKSLVGEANLLFRGNSLLTQALECHMRRLGKEYLEEILAEKIFEINEINPNCEVDPAKVQPGEDIQQHWAHLTYLTADVWACIASSANRLPAELRHILKYVRAVAEDRYGDFLRPVMYTSVSAFLFLRFICPAILNPKLFGLLRDHPRPQAQRTLTLMAKGLQALANLSTIGKKEVWMEPMNRFINGERQMLKDFLDQVCAIPTERASVALSASYSTPITILGRLSTISREGFPSLPYLIDHGRNFAALVKMWTDINPLVKPGATPSATPELTEFSELCNALQRRANDCHSRIEGLRYAETSSLLAEDLGDAMEQTHLASPVNSPLGSSPGWMEHSTDSRPSGSSDTDVSGLVTHTLREHSGWRQSSSLSQETAPHVLAARSQKNGKQARRFLGGFMRKTRPISPASTSPNPGPLSPSSTIRERAREIQRQFGEVEKEREREKEERKRVREKDKELAKERERELEKEKKKKTRSKIKEREGTYKADQGGEADVGIDGERVPTGRLDAAASQ